MPPKAKLFTLMGIILLTAIISSFYASHYPMQRHISLPLRAQRLSSCCDDFKLTLELFEIIQISLVFHVLGFLIVRYTFQTMAVRFISFDTNLNMLKTPTPPKLSYSVLWILLAWLLCTGISIQYSIALAFHLYHDAYLYPRWTLLKVGNHIFPFVIYLHLSLTAVTPSSYLVSLVATYAMCLYMTKRVPPGSPCFSYSCQMILS